MAILVRVSVRCLDTKVVTSEVMETSVSSKPVYLQWEVNTTKVGLTSVKGYEFRLRERTDGRLVFGSPEISSIASS